MDSKFEDLIKKLSPTLRRITHRLNGHFSFFDEADLFQEALIHLWVLFNRGELSDKTDSYILQGCYFHLKNYLRKTLDKSKFISISAFIEDGCASIEEFIAADGGRYTERIDEALLDDFVKSSSLSEREGAVLSFLSDGLSVRDVGRKMGMSHVTVLKIRMKIKNKCRMLKKDERTSYHN